MTEDESDLLHDLKTRYWLDFSRLVASYVEKVPEHLRFDMMMHMQESSSVYGARTSPEGEPLRPLAYLASPYSSPSAAVVAERVRLFALKAAEIERDGKFHVASAMYNHLLVSHEMSLPTSWAFWRSYSLSMLSKCDVLYVLRTPGWDSSAGVAGEIQFANERGIPVEFLDP